MVPRLSARRQGRGGAQRDRHGPRRRRGDGRVRGWIEAVGGGLVVVRRSTSNEYLQAGSMHS